MRVFRTNCNIVEHSVLDETIGFTRIGGGDGGVWGVENAVESGGGSETNHCENMGVRWIR